MAARCTNWTFLGRVPYAATAALQVELREALRRGEGPERLLLLEHDPVFSLGRNATAADVLWSAEELAEHGVEGGVVHRISELRRRQGDLQNRIAALRRPAADLPVRIEQLISGIDAVTSSIERIEIRHREIDADTLQLEQQLIEMRRRTVLPLSRQTIEGEICEVTSQLDRWREIRRLIGHERAPDRITA